MVKISSMDIISLLRRFDVAGEENVPRHVEQVKITNTSPLNTLVSFRFNKLQYYALFDDDAQDNPDYVRAQVQIEKEGANGQTI